MCPTAATTSLQACLSLISETSDCCGIPSAAFRESLMRMRGHYNTYEAADGTGMGLSHSAPEERAHPSSGGATPFSSQWAAFCAARLLLNYLQFGLRKSISKATREPQTRLESVGYLSRGKQRVCEVSGGAVAAQTGPNRLLQ